MRSRGASHAQARSGPGLLLVLLPALLAAAAVMGPGSASAARGLSTGIGDGIFLDSRAGFRGLWLDRLREGNAKIVRLTVNWSFIAGLRPSNTIDPADPAYRWAATDRAVLDARARGLEVAFLIAKAPVWAEGPDRPPGAQEGSWKPNAVEFGRFARAIARRYSGSFPNPSGPGNLPRVRYYEVWNEPNLDFWLAPQFEGPDFVAPEMYRALHNAFAEGAKAVREDNQVIGPALAPFGGEDSDRTRTRPIAFMRDLFCLEGRARLEPKRCPGGERLEIDIVSHHPISVRGGPDFKAFHPDDASSGDVNRVRRTLRAAEKGKTISPAGRRPIWATEFWFRSNPPVEDGVPLNRHARWIQQELYVFWKDRVEVAIYNLIRDRPRFDPDSAFGLFFRNGDEKPAYTAFSFPFVADRKGPRKLLVWGKAPASGKLKIERRKGKRWKKVKRIRVREGRVFKKRLRLRGKQKLRARVRGEKSLTWNQKR